MTALDRSARRLGGFKAFCRRASWLAGCPQGSNEKSVQEKDCAMVLMSCAVDAGCLRECLSGVSSPADASLAAALAKFQEQRIERTAREVLFSRHLGRIKQCLDNSQDWFAAEEPTSKGLGQANMDSFLVTV